MLRARRNDTCAKTGPPLPGLSGISFLSLAAHAVLSIGREGCACKPCLCQEFLVPFFRANPGRRSKDFHAPSSHAP
jgi:hypothetical protein